MKLSHSRDEERVDSRLYRAYLTHMKTLATVLLLLTSLSLTACENKAYKDCLDKEQKSEAAYLDKVKGCSALTDTTKKKECLQLAESTHFKAGCDSLK